MTVTTTVPAARRRAAPPPLRSLPIPDLAPGSTSPPAACPGQVVLDLDGAGEEAGAAVDPTGEVDPLRWAAQFAHAAFEVSIGHRPPGQLVRWTSERVQTLLERRYRLAGPIPGAGVPGPVRVLTVRTCRSADGAVEAAAVLIHRGRARAVALRLEPDGGRWRVGALQIG